MQNKLITLALLVLLTGGGSPAHGETAPAPERVSLPAAPLSDEALASYISGRLEPLLKDTGYQVSQSCDASGCAVVVQ